MDSSFANTLVLTEKAQELNDAIERATLQTLRLGELLKKVQEKRKAKYSKRYERRRA